MSEGFVVVVDVVSAVVDAEVDFEPNEMDVVVCVIDEVAVLCVAVAAEEVVVVSEGLANPNEKLELASVAFGNPNEKVDLEESEVVATTFGTSELSLLFSATGLALSEVDSVLSLATVSSLSFFSASLSLIISSSSKDDNKSAARF